MIQSHTAARFELNTNDDKSLGLELSDHHRASTVASSHWSHICKQWILPIPSDSLRRSYEMTTPFLEIEVKCSLKAAL